MAEALAMVDDTATFVGARPVASDSDPLFGTFTGPQGAERFFGIFAELIEPGEFEVVKAVPRYGPRFGEPFLMALGVVEVALALWVLSGAAPLLCAIAQTVLLVSLNTNGLIFARHVIHDPRGMVVKNFAFLVLAWVAASVPAEAGP